AGVAAAPKTLQDRIDAGSTGVTIGDKQFYNFSYQASPLGGASPAPTASTIGIAAAPGDDIGVRFTVNLSAANGLNQDAIIRYSVHVLDTTPQNFITAVNLDFNPTVTPGLINIATVTETISKLDGTTLGQITTIDMGPGALGNNSHASFGVG